MSGQYVRLPDSKRNELISKFHNGVVDPNYEVIPSKNTEGRYTIRKRKVPLPVPSQSSQSESGVRQNDSEDFRTDAQPQEQPETQEQAEEPEYQEMDPYMDDRAYFPQFKLNKNAMFRELQIQMNRMMIENMKLMRQQVKATEKKRQKLKEKSKRMSEFLSKVLDEAEQAPVEEEPHEEEEVVEEQDTPKQEPKSDEEEVVQPKPVDLTNYEEKLNQLAGDVGQGYSRRDRLHFERFNI